MNEADESLSTGSIRCWLSHPAPALFLASFVSLFLELLLIRWVPSRIRIVAYYGNLMLISSFLGLGCGALLAPRGLGLRRWFGLFLLCFVLFVSAIKGMNFQQGPDELRYLFREGNKTTVLPIAAVFLFNALLFLPLGELIGSYFRRMPPLRAYSWDLGGAITGTLIFGVFSYFWFSPTVGFIIAMAVYLIYLRRLSSLAVTGLCFAASLGIIAVKADQSGVWSPYNYISVRQWDSTGNHKPVSAPPINLSTMRDPPLYIVEVNRDFYLEAGTLDGRRYTKPDGYLVVLTEVLGLPHQIRRGAKDVLVVGSGAGISVEVALMYGAERVDAVEIDPVIIQLGRRYNASQSYKDPRVSVYNTDARAFFKQTDKTYDMVVFGFLDSQSIFSQMSNIRLDGYVYTRESFQEAFDRLKPGGLLSISFFSSGKGWLVDRLVSMVRSATDTVPRVYVAGAGQVIILAGKGPVPEGPRRLLGLWRIAWVPSGTPEATDDWPYLYLRRRFIPLDYLVNIGLLLVISFFFVFLGSGKSRKRIDLHFFLLGAGFLLLETKSITTISLYFGTTWFVSMVVIVGVLFMVFLANIVASRIQRFPLTLYLPLLASIAFLYVFPSQPVLAWSFPVRLLYSLVVIPLPIFFAGLIFSTTFRESRDPSFSFGSNLLGAMVGGFTEYLGIVTGMKALLLVVLVFYLASLLVRLRAVQAIPAGA